MTDDTLGEALQAEILNQAGSGPRVAVPIAASVAFVSTGVKAARTSAVPKAGPNTQYRKPAFIG